MPFKRTRSSLRMTPEEREKLEQISKSCTKKASCVMRAQILLRYDDGEAVASIARFFSISRPTVDRCINKALNMGVMTALNDLPRCGKPCTITPEARTWVISLACQKPKDMGYASELWTNLLLAEHIRTHCLEAGHPSLVRIGRGTITKILTRSSVKPYKITYYLEKRDPDFKEKMTCVLHVYKEVLNEIYPKDMKIRMILDNHSAHISKETKKYLSQVPNRFEFIFTPKHSSWLNIIESLFAKMTKTFLREIRVDSKSELKHRIMLWVEEMNRTPIIFRWKYGLDSLT